MPNAFVNRRTKAPESAIAVVEGEDWLNATACGPYRVEVIPAHGLRCHLRASSQEIGTHPGIGLALGACAAQWLSQTILVINKLGSGTAFGAKRLTGRVRRIRVKAPETAVHHSCD